LPIVAATLISRPLGYIRAAIQAWLFGATAAMDAFVVAFNVPSILQVVLLSGPLSSVLVPTLTAYRHDRRALNDLFNSLFTLCCLLGLALAGGAALAAPLLMRLAGPGLPPDTQSLATLLFRLMLPMLVMQALLSVCKGALNTLDHYGAPEYAGVIFNIVVIGAALLLSPYMGIISLAIGASLGGIAQVIMQFPFLAQHGIRYRPSLRLGVLRQMSSLAPGAFLSTIITPLGAFIDRALATLLFTGAPSALHYGFLLFMLPASLAIIPLSTVLLTDLASLYHQGEIRTLHHRTQYGLRLMLLITIPAALLGGLLAAPITRLVYEHGHFQAADTLRAAQALRAYLAGLPLYGCVHLITRSFYALQDTFTPALVGLGALLINVIADLVLMQFFSHWGIALARTITLLFSAIMLYSLFQRRCSILRGTRIS
jgi:putative peptidoglycan lipid II flippase